MRKPNLRAFIHTEVAFMHERPRFEFRKHESVRENWYHEREQKGNLK